MNELLIFLCIIAVLSFHFYIVYLASNWYEVNICSVDNIGVLIVLFWPLTVWFIPIMLKRKKKIDINEWMDGL